MTSGEGDTAATAARGGRGGVGIFGDAAVAMGFRAGDTMRSGVPSDFAPDARGEPGFFEALAEGDTTGLTGDLRDEVSHGSGTSC